MQVIPVTHHGTPAPAEHVWTMHHGQHSVHGPVNKPNRNGDGYLHQYYTPFPGSANNNAPLDEPSANPSNELILREDTPTPTAVANSKGGFNKFYLFPIIIAIIAIIIMAIVLVIKCCL